MCVLHTHAHHIYPFSMYGVLATENVLYLLDLCCRDLEYNPLNSAAPALFEVTVQLFKPATTSYSV